MFRPKCLEDDHVVNSIHEFRRELSPRRFLRRVAQSFIELCVNIEKPMSKSKPSAGNIIHFRRAQVGGHENQAPGKVNAPVISKRERRFVKNAQQKLPQRIGSFFDLVEEQQGQLKFWRVPLIQCLLRECRMGLAMTEVAGRRTDELGDLVAVLKLGAVDLKASPRVTEQRLRYRLNDARLS